MVNGQPAPEHHGVGAGVVDVPHREGQDIGDGRKVHAATVVEYHNEAMDVLRQLYEGRGNIRYHMQWLVWPCTWCSARTSPGVLYMRRGNLRNVPAHHGRDAERDLDDKQSLAATPRRPSRDARIPRPLRTREAHLHVNVRWVEQVLVRRLGGNAFPQSSCRRRRAGRIPPSHVKLRGSVSTFNSTMPKPRAIAM